MKLNDFLSADFRLVGANQIAVTIGSFFLLRFLAEILSSDDFGNFNLLLSVGAVFSGLIYGGLEQSISRYCSVYRNNKKFMPTVYALIIVISILLLFLYALTIKLTDFKGVPYLYIMGGFLFVLMSVNSILNTVSNSNFDRKGVLYNSLLLISIKIITILILWSCFHINLINLVYIYIFSTIVVINRQIKSNSIKKINNFSKEIAVDLLSFSLPFILSGLFISFQSIADRWFIEMLMKTSDVARYMAYYQMTYVPCAIFINAIINYLAPIYYHQTSIKEVNKSDLKKISLIIIIVGLLVSGLLYSFADFFTQLLVPKKYFGASLLIPVLILSGVIQAAATLLSIDMIANLKISKILFYKSCLSILYFLYAYPLISNFGLYGASFSVMLHSLSTYFLVFNSIKKNV
jgi:O-antigen/teichoic acid export membrane protein